jgi:hypothetical protein
VRGEWLVHIFGGGVLMFIGMALLVVITVWVTLAGLIVLRRSEIR